MPITISLSDIKLHIPDGHDDTIDIGGGISIKMKYPSMQQFLENNFIAPPDETNQDRIDKAFESVAGCIDQVFTEEEAWSASDCTKKELLTFIESLNSQQFGKIENFFTTMPRLRYKSTVKNPKTDVESEVVIEVSNFRIMLYRDLDYYESNFSLMQHHDWNLSDIEDMIPFEREIYITLLSNYMRKEFRGTTSKECKLLLVITNRERKW